MKINNIKSQSNFTGYYKLPNTKENAQIIYNNLKPLMKEYNESMHAFLGKNPFSLIYAKNLKDLAKQNNVQVHWIRNNAKNYNVELPDEELNTIFVSTGFKDTDKILSLNQNAMIYSTFGIIKEIFKNIFGLNRQNGKPYWLDGVKVLANTYNRLQSKFDNYISTKPVKELNSASELIKAIKKEINA